MTRLTRRIVWLTTTLLPIVACSAVAQPPSPAPRPQRVEIVRDWCCTGRAKIRLTSDRTSSQVKSVYVNTKYEKRGWLTQIEGQAQIDGDAKLEVSAMKNLLDQTSTFAAWRHSSEDNALETGLETALFGQDKLRLSYQVQPLTKDLQAQAEVSYKYSLWGDNSLKITGARKSEQSEVGGELMHKENSGLMWSASLTTQKTISQDSWESPQLEGRFRWTW
jgi:hypothetical protein